MEDFQEDASQLERIQQLEKAIELEVDKADFHFQSLTEEQLWDELQQEFLERSSKLGQLWVAA